VQTEGYSRQRVDINSVSNGGYIQRYKPQEVTAGGGVEAKSVSRIRDQFLDARYRMQNAEDKKFAAILSGLGDIENVVDQVSTDGLLAEIANFKKALDPMLENPPSNDMAMVVRNAAQKVASLLNTYAQHIENVRDQQIYDLQNVYIDTEFNSVVKNIGALNRQINEEMAHGNTPNELLDERDLLFDKLSGLANVRINISPKWLSSSLKVEHVEVFLVDDNTGKEIDLINDETYNTLSLVKNPDNTVSINVNSAFGNDSPRVRDATRYLTSGTIGGALNIINGKGAEFGSPLNEDNLFRGTLYYEGMLNTFAANFARALNDINAYNPNGELPRSMLVSTPGAGYDPTVAPPYKAAFDNSSASYDAEAYRNAVADYRSMLVSTYGVTGYNTSSPYYDAHFDSNATAYELALVTATQDNYKSILVSNPGAGYDKDDPFYDKTLDSDEAADYDPARYADILNDYLSEDRPLFSTIDGSSVITAANIKISQEWLDDPMRLTVTQPGDLSEGENIGRMIVAIEKGLDFYRDGDADRYPNKLFSGTFEEYFTGLNATLGLDVSLYTNYSKTSENVMNTLFTARESVSGVSLDEEGVALMAYQKSYNAAVRFFTVLDESVDKIINSMGLVGR
jgi:flagellar hook-associated protein 1 FlgK